MKHHRMLDRIVFFLLIVGGLNMGLMGLFQSDVIGMIFSWIPGVARLIEVLIGLAAVYRLGIWVRAKMH